MTHDDAQSPDEMSANIGPGTAAEFVRAWVDVVLNHRDWALAMQVATPELRLAAAQLFVAGARDVGLAEVFVWDRDALAANLAAVNTANPLWDAYAGALLDSFEPYRGIRFATGTGQRLVDIDHERVVLIDWNNSPQATRIVDGREMKVVAADEPLVGWPLVARRAQDGWLLASYGENLPRPGWPPFLG